MEINDLPGLRQLVADLGFVQSRGRGAGTAGSVRQFLNELKAGHVAAFVAAEWPVLLATAGELEALAAGHGNPAVQDTMLGIVAALRAAADRQRAQETDDDDDDGLRLTDGKLGRYADIESAKRSAALALRPVVIQYDDHSYDWLEAEQPVGQPIGRYEIVARREGVGPWRGG